jgi:hypothetical protein
MMGRPHIVLLGAGASRATSERGDVIAGTLPVMADLVDQIGLAPDLDRLGVPHRGRNFEEVYSELFADVGQATALRQIEDRIRDYFSTLRLVQHPTIYDHLLLSLRDKDVVATFNWDPLLFDAWNRVGTLLKRFGRRPPHILHLHGNVRVAYCQRDRVQGDVGGVCHRCRQPLQPTPLLWPIGKKDYASDPFIATAWELVQNVFPHGYILTIFGYSGPASDAEAMALLSGAWGDPNRRELEQVEIIDKRSEDDLIRTWRPFVCSDHYDTPKSFYDSWIARHPRRSCDAMWDQFELKFPKANPIPATATFDELLRWVEPLLDEERNAEAPTDSVQP